MKICAECAFSDRVPVQVGHGQAAMATVCTNEECRDPVEGHPLPAAQARRDPSFCGIKAVFWKKKEDKPTAPLVQLA